MAEERVREVVEALVENLRGVIRDKKVNYDEFHAAIQFLVRLGDAKEIPLLLAVFLEATVDDVTHAQTKGSTTTIQGPFHIPGAPTLQAPYKLPRRADEPGDLLVVSGTVHGTDGGPLPGAELDMWQATGDLPGKYSNVHPGLPDFNLRGRFVTDDQGQFSVETVVPAQYEIRKNGPTGELFELLGRSAWRPAHLHFKVSHPDHRTLTTQLFFNDDQYLASDAGNAVKPGLVIPLVKTEGEDPPGFRATYDFVLEPS
ncbi:MAG: catechol 1,2-dioxygenase [Acidimicrobiales bacterium]